MKNIIKTLALILSICFIAKNSTAQSTANKPVVAVKKTTQELTVAPAKTIGTDSTAKKYTIPDPVAAIARQGVEILKTDTLRVVQLPVVSQQEQKAKKD